MTYRPGCSYFPGGFDYEDATIDSMPKSVRVFSQTEQVKETEAIPFRWIGERVKAFQSRDKRILGTLTPGNPAAWNEMSVEEWARIVTLYAQNVPTRVVEVGNEPGKAAFPGYFPKLHAASEILRAAGKRVISGAPYPSATKAFMEEAHRRGAWEWVDGIGLHPYAPTPAKSLDQVRTVRMLLDSYGARHHLHLTEFGWATKGPEHIFRVTEDQQAEYLAEAFANWKANAEKLRLAFCLYYIWQDWPQPGKPDSWVYHCGVVRPDGSAKPSLAALQAV